VVILRDLVERHQIRNTVPLRYLIRHLINANAGLFSVNKFYHDLKSQGIACGKNALHEYLGHLADAYLFFQVFLCTRSERARMVNPRKIYAIDPGLVHACSRSIRPEWGHLLENFVFLELRRHNSLIEYYKTSSGREVDFLVTDSNGQKALFQVSASMDQTATRKRELEALEEAMKETGLNTATIVTINDEENLNVETGRVRVLPAWMWALNLQ